MLAQGKKIYSRYTEDVHYELWQLYIYMLNCWSFIAFQSLVLTYPFLSTAKTRESNNGAT